MSVWTRIIVPAFIGGLTVATSAFSVSLIGDFAPLQVNDVWKYKGYAFSDMGSGASSTDSSLRTITLKSKSLSGDTSVYKISIRDSLFTRTLIQKNGSNLDTTHPASQILTDSGTVLEALDGSLSSSNFILQIFFYRHSVPDSAITGKITVGGQTYWTYSPGAATYAQNFGLLTWNLLPQESYRLISFNGTSLGDFTVVGILDERYANRRSKSFGPSLRNLEMIPGTNRNSLGRFLIRRNR